MTNSIKFLKIREVISPSRAHATDAGIDFFVPVFTEEFMRDLENKNPWLPSESWVPYNLFVIPPHQKALIPSGIKCKMSESSRALIAFNKSGIASKLGLIAGSCVVDYEYEGEIHISVINTTDVPVIISENMKLMQFIEIPIYLSSIEMVDDEKILFEDLSSRTRGTSGFGDSDNVIDFRVLSEPHHLCNLQDGTSDLRD